MTLTWWQLMTNIACTLVGMVMAGGLVWLGARIATRAAGHEGPLIFDPAAADIADTAGELVDDSER